MPKFYVSSGPKENGVRAIFDATHPMEAAVGALIVAVNRQSVTPSLGEWFMVSKRGMRERTSDVRGGDQGIETEKVIAACGMEELYGLR